MKTEIIRQINKIFKHEKIAALICGIIATGGLPPYYFFVLTMLGFSGLLLLLEQSKSKKESFLLGYLFGFGFFSVGFAWVGNAVLIDAGQTGWLYPIILLASGAYFGLYAAIPSLLTFFYKNIFEKIFVFSAGWTIFEWLRGFILTGFAWNPIGSVLAFSDSLIQIASVFGVYGLSFFVAVFSIMPVALFKGKKNALVASSSMLTIALILWGFGILRLNEKTTFTEAEVLLVQPSIPQDLKWDRKLLESNFMQYVEMSETNKSKVDFVVWGETASPFNPKLWPEYDEQYTKAIPEGGYLLFGAVDYEYYEGDRYPKNSMLVMNDQRKIVASYDKVHLVPFGEYIPFRKYLPNFVRPVASLIGDFKKGEGHKVMKIGNLPSFSALICYEVIFPGEVLDKNERPQWIAVLTNDGWYGKSAGPYQHLIAAKMRAVEEGLPVIRSANSGISAVIDAYGRIVASAGLHDKDIVKSAIPEALGATFYSVYKNLTIIFICLLVLIICTIFKYRLERKF